MAPPWRRTAGLYAGALALVAAATFAVHGPAIADNFHRRHWEDRRFFVHTRSEIHGPLDCFTHAGAWPGLYRPLTTNCYYLAGRVLWSDRIEVYHAINVAVYVAGGLLFFVLARRLLPELLALVAAGFWASRLAQWQTLLYTSEFQGLFATLLALAALACALSTRVARDDGAPSTTGWRREALGLLFFAAALLSKESAVAVAAIVSVATWLYAPRAWRRDLAWWGLALVWALLFATVLRGLAGTSDTGYVYDASLRGIAGRTVGYLLMFANASVDRSVSSGVPVLVPPLAHDRWLGMVLLAALLALVALAPRARGLPATTAGRGARGMVFGTAWFLAASAPFVVLDDRLFLRYSIFGNAGLALLVVSAAAVLSDWRSLRARPEAAGAATGPTTAPAPL